MRSYQKLVTEIMDLNLNEEIHFVNDECNVNSVYFEREPQTCLDRDLRGLYSWVGKSGWRNIFPMRGAQYVKYFKTLNGAKRNFIQSYLIKEEK